jgi:regulator of cell morphogenesis and NO signaling
MHITTESRVGEIAAEHPLATRVFARHGIDFCCGGGVPLAQACAKRGLDAPQLVAEIEATLDGASDTGERWLEAPLQQLVRHILVDYHEPLREELPRLEAMARKVARVHGEREPVRLPALLQSYLALEAELVEHIAREEVVLFPPLLERGAAAALDVAGFRDDHEEVGRRLAELRELTDDFQAPEGACNTWRALWAGLEALEASLHEHVHLENNVLFPRLAAAA